MTAKSRRILGVAAALVLGVPLWIALAGHRVPAGQPPLVDLGNAGLQTLQDEFNRGADEVRVILLLSPT